MHGLRRASPSSVVVGGGHRGISVGSRTRIYPGNRIVTDPMLPTSGIVIGEDCAINYDGYIGGNGGVLIGNRVLIGPHVRILSAGHAFGDESRPIRDQGLTWGQVSIEDDVWIGAGATVLQGVTIGAHSVIAAGAVVSKDVPAHSIALGVPARTRPIPGAGA